MFIAYHLNIGFYKFIPKAEHIETLEKDDGNYTVARLLQNYYYNSKTGKVSRSTKELGESFISFDDGKTFVRLPWFIPAGSEDFYRNAIKQNVAKMSVAARREETNNRINNAVELKVA